MGEKGGKTRLQGSAGAGTDEILFRPGAQARCPSTSSGVAKFVLGTDKTYVQTGARAPSLNRA